jgi:predicted phosphate transport protein (TIGR00153 family)
LVYGTEKHCEKIAMKRLLQGGMAVFFKKEKEVVELLMRHLDTVEECLATAVRTLQIYLKGDTREAKSLALQVDHIESEADSIRRSIRDKFYSGAYLPLIREDIYRLVESIDKIADAAESCCDFFLAQRPLIPDDLRSQFDTVIRESLGIIEPLKAAVLCSLKGECPIEVVRQYTKTVGVKESDVDKLEWDLTRNIFTSTLDFSQKIHLKLCLDSIAEVSDRAEDAADQLELATLKSMV